MSFHRLPMRKRWTRHRQTAAEGLRIPFYGKEPTKSVALCSDLPIAAIERQGDVVKLIDSSGTSVVQYTYDTWGAQNSCTGTLATSLGQGQPFRYRGYVYDTETGWYYLQSRYYNPATCRFISADVLLSTGQGVLGHNSFAYCGNDPINRIDESGCGWVTNLLVAVAIVAAVVAVVALCVVTAGTATVAVAGVGTALCMTSTAAAEVAAVAGATSVIAASAAKASSENDKKHSASHPGYTVYTLSDSEGVVQYVGRTVDPVSRRAAHRSNPARASLEFQVVASDLNYTEARGMEQLLMAEYHTINTLDRMNNQINGISPANKKRALYLEAGSGALRYLENQVSNEFLNLIGQ